MDEAEPIKQWLAKTGSEKLDEIALQGQMGDPEVSRPRTLVS